jgi:hypothetical protein
MAGVGGDPFDVEALRVDPASPNLQPKAAPRKASKWQKLFVRVPWAWVDRLKDARHISTYRVALHVLYEFWRNGGRAILLSNAALNEANVPRWAKWDALRELEGLGLVAVERRPRKSPVVRLLLVRCEET